MCIDAFSVHIEIIDDKGNWLAPKVTSKIPKKWIQKELVRAFFSNGIDSLPDYHMGESANIDEIEFFTDSEVER